MLGATVTHCTLSASHSQLSKNWSLWSSPSAPTVLPPTAAADLQHHPSRRLQAPGWLLTDYRVVICKALPPLLVKSTRCGFWICDLTAPLYDCSARARRQQSAGSIFQQHSCSGQILLWRHYRQIQTASCLLREPIRTRPRRAWREKKSLLLISAIPSPSTGLSFG